MSDEIPFVPALIGYGLGYLPFLLTRTWRGHLAVLLGECLLFALFLYALYTAPGLATLVVAFLAGPFLFGMVAGAVVKPVLLVTKWPSGSLRGLLTIVTGVALLPGGIAAWRAVRIHDVARFYDRLPTAEILPPIPACAPFRGAGPVIDSVRTVRAADGTDGRLALRYPVAYDTSLRDHDHIPSPGDAGRSFKAHILDGRPLTQADEQDAEGNRLPPDAQSPWVLFHVASDPAEKVGGLAYSQFRDRVARMSPDALARKSSDPADLVEIARPEQTNELHDDDHFVAMTGGRPTGHLGCWNTDPVRYSVCLFSIEHGGSILSGSFRRVDVERWPDIRRLVENFTDCSLAAAAPPSPKP